MPEIIAPSDEVLANPAASEFLAAISAPDMPWAIEEGPEIDRFGDHIPQAGLRFLGLGGIGLAARVVKEDKIRISQRGVDWNDAMQFGTPSELYPVVCEASGAGVFRAEAAFVRDVQQASLDILSVVHKLRANRMVVEASRELLTHLSREADLGRSEDLTLAQEQAAIVEKLLATTKEDLPEQFENVQERLRALGVYVVEDKYAKNTVFVPDPLLPAILGGKATR